MEPAVVLRGGNVVDGTGDPARRADVALAAGRVVDVGDRIDAPAGARELDVTGLTVTPGFVDIHTHYDAQVLWDPACTPSGWHGVTTVVAGNCGFSIAPCKPEHRGLLARTLENVEGMSLEALEAGIAWEFETYPEYLATIERRGTAINFGGYVGHTAVRVYVMGDDAYERVATDDEVGRMCEVVAASVSAGALGFATSTSPTHAGDGGRPVPSRWADAREINALAGVLDKLDRGVFAIIPGVGVTHRDMYAMAPAYGRPITWTALLTGLGGFHSTMADVNAKVRAEGGDVWPQVSCRPLVFQMTMAAPFAFESVPVWSELGALTRDERAARYGDPSWRARAREATDSSYLARRFQATSVDETEKFPELVGRPLSDVADERGTSALDVMLDIALDEDLTTRFRVVTANDDQEGIAYLLQQPGMLLGLSDAGAHVSQLCDACMPTDLLGNWVREKGVLTLEQAVHKLTGEPARVFGLADRGVLRPGAAADVTVFDAGSVAPGPLRRVNDLPAGADRLLADSPEGIAHVFVNGTPIVSDGRRLAADPERLPGTVVRSAVG